MARGLHHGAGHGHQHVPAEAGRRRLFLALALVPAFMAAEIVVGLVASSLALLFDAGHMLTDAIAIGWPLWRHAWPSGRQVGD